MFYWQDNKPPLCQHNGNSSFLKIHTYIIITITDNYIGVNIHTPLFAYIIKYEIYVSVLNWVNH